MSHFVQEMGTKKDAFKLSIRLMPKWWFRTCSAGGGVKSVLSLYFNSVQKSDWSDTSKGPFALWKREKNHEAGLPDNSPFEDGYRLGTFRGAFALFCLYRPAALSPTPQLSLAYTNDCSVAGSIRRTRGPHCYSMFRLSKRKKEL